MEILPVVPEVAPVFLLLFLVPPVFILVSFLVEAILSCPDFSFGFTGASVCSGIKKKLINSILDFLFFDKKYHYQYLIKV